jgi:two-component system sensor histidine kinase PilS (NtrC family)
MDFYGMLPARLKVFLPAVQPAWDDVLTTVSTNILAFFTVAYLTGYLAERMARAEKELEEKGLDFERLEQLNRSIVGNITSGILTVDESSRITSFNKAAEEITGYSLKEVYYRPVDSVFPGILESNTQEAGMRLEKMVKKKKGTEIFLGFSISEGQGGDAAKIVIFQDLTRLKAMEEQLRRVDKLRALGELSVGIAHEVRNPLASISGSIQVLKEDLDLHGDDRRLMEIVVRETERLNTLITDFLLFARPAQQRRERINLSEIINEKIELFSHSPQASGLDIEGDIKDQFFIQGDLRQIGQVFWNLFLNSAQSMQEGGRLTIASSVKNGANGTDPGPLVSIEVADTGCGIKGENLQMIFDPFYSTKEMGTGLGLAIAHSIVESHGGTVEVRSAPGKGTVFKIVLPLVGVGTLH